MYKDIFEKSTDGMLIIKNDKFVDCNDTIVKMLRYETKDEFLNTHPSELSPEMQPDGRSSFDKVEENTRVVLEKGHRKFEWVHLRADGEPFWVEVVLTNLSEGDDVTFLVIWREIGEKKRLEEKEHEYKRELEEKSTLLSNQYRLIHNIIDTVPVRIFWKNKEGKYLGANKLFVHDCKLRSESELIGKSDYELPWSKEEAQSYIDDDRKIMESGRAKINFENSRTNDKGETIVVLTSKLPLKNIEGKTIGVLGAYTDISYLREVEDALKNQNDILEYQAYHDELTKLPNRALFDDRLQHALEEAYRNDKKLALLFVDLDHFKEINDSLGHMVGDDVLKIIAERLLAIVRKNDTVARFGGDEFALILEDLKQEEEASYIAQKILKEFSEPIKIKGLDLYVLSSIGISIYPDDADTASNLLKYADSAMYRAKKEGRNNFQYYSSEMTESSLKRVIMDGSLREALKNDELVVYYQPQYDGSNDELIGMEALVRWEHRTKGLVSPVNFIPLAESTGLIVEIDHYVMKTAMQQISQWYKEGLTPGRLSINLAENHLRQKNFIDRIDTMMKTTGCKAQWLEFEITESQVMHHPEEAIKLLQRISDRGISIAIDDFGTGYSSLSYLKRLPINKLKIDQSFVIDLPDNEDVVAIVQAIIALGKSLKLQIIAEGVENRYQKDFLLQNGCEYIQGYLYAKPMDSDRMYKLLQLK